MKTLSKILLISFFVSNTAMAQGIVKDYFDTSGKTKDASKSIYYRIGKKMIVNRKDGLGRDTILVDTVFTYYSSTNTIRTRSFYKEGIQQGPYTFYHENGKIQEKGFYMQNARIGYITQWYDKGTVKQTMQYFFVENRPLEQQDSFKIINYFDEANNQLIKNGNGYCKCYFRWDDPPLEEGKVSSGYRDSIWQITFADTLVAYDEYEAGTFIKGESVYKGSHIKYDQKFVMPEFKGGMQGMLTFLKQTIRYPSEAKRNGTQGRVFVRFVIDANGNVSDLEIVKGVSDALDRESIRVVKASNKKWIPAKSRGIPVKSAFVLPVYFKLES